MSPSPSDAATLQAIAQRESSGNYTAKNPTTTASGAYQMINTTWQMAASAVGIDTSAYPTASSAPPEYQDAAALWLLQKYGPNASITWAASAPSGGYQSGGGDTPIIDLSGVAANTSTPDILSQLGTDISSAASSIDPTTGLVLLGLGAVAALVAFSR